MVHKSSGREYVMRNGWNVILRYDEDFRRVNLWLIKKNADGSEVVVQPLNLTLTHTITPGVETPPPTIRFEGAEAHQFLQGLVEGLVASGYRPDMLKAQDREVEALKYHLEDMRKLVMEALIPPEFTPVIPRR